VKKRAIVWFKLANWIIGLIFLAVIIILLYLLRDRIIETIKKLVDFIRFR